MADKKIARPRLEGPKLTGKSRRISMWFTTGLIREIQQEAEPINTSRSSLVRQVVALYLTMPVKERRALRDVLHEGTLADGEYEMVIRPKSESTE